MAEIVVRISTANRFNDFAAVPPLTLLVHTEYGDYFVALSRQESASKGAAERVSGALVQVGLPVLPVTCSSVRETSGWEFDPTKLVVVFSRHPVWRLPLAILHVASLGWASQDEISFLVGYFTFRALVRRAPGHLRRCLHVLDTVAARDGGCGCPSSVNIVWPRA